MKRVQFNPVPGDPKGAALTFFTDLCTELCRARALSAIEKNPKYVIKECLVKIHSKALRDAVQRCFNVSDEAKRKDFDHFREEVMRLSGSYADLEIRMDARDNVSAPSRSGNGKRGREEAGPSHSAREASKGTAAADKSKAGAKANGGTKERKEWTQECLNPLCPEKYPVRKCPVTSTEKAQ